MKKLSIYMRHLAFSSHLKNIVALNAMVSIINISYTSSSAECPGEFDHLIKDLRRRLRRRSSPVPSPSMRRRRRITSSTMKKAAINY
jgi:hypothetical protein